MLSRHIYLTLILLFQLSLLSAQNIQIAGKVISKTDKTPLAFASITESNTQTYVFTDPEGYFTLELPEKKELKITVSHLGYITQTIEITPKDTRQLIIGLENDFTTIHEIVITGTRTPKLIKDSPILTRVITSKEIEKLNTGSFLSLLEAELPGLEFTSNANVPNINLQGLGGNYVLFLIDGERIAGETRNNIDYEMLNPNNIERIEIVKGSLSTLYGSNAMGGVINIITKKSSKPFHLDITTRGGSYGEQQYGISGGTKAGKFSGHTAALWKTSDNYTLKDRVYLKRVYADTVITDNILRTREIEGGEVLNLEQKAGYDFSEKFSSEIKGNYLKRERFNAGAEGTVMHNFYYGYIILSKSNWKINQANQLELTYNFSGYDKINYYRIVDIEEKDYTNKLHNIRLISNNRLSEKQLLTSGIEYLTEALSTYMFSEGDDFSADSYTAYTQHDYTVTDKFNMISGIRWDKHSNYGGNMSPKISLKYNPLRNTSVRATYATGFRSPSLKELHTNWDHLGMFQIIGNPNLNPEKSNTITVTADYGTNKIYVSANAFHNNIKDKLNLYWNAANDTVYYRNADKQIIKGIEVNATVSPLKNFRLQAGYTFTDDGYKEGGKNFSPTRPHTATLRINYTVFSGNYRTFIGINGKFLSQVEVYVQEEENVYYKIDYPGYSIWRLHISEQYKDKITLSAGINNMFDYTAPVNSFYAPVSPGRTYFVNLSINVDSFFKNKV